VETARLVVRPIWTALILTKLFWEDTLRMSLRIRSPVIDEEEPKSKRRIVNNVVASRLRSRVKKTPASSVKKTPASSVKKTPASSVRKTSAKSVRKTPVASARKTSGKSVRKTPVASVKRTTVKRKRNTNSNTNSNISKVSKVSKISTGTKKSVLNHFNNLARGNDEIEHGLYYLYKSQATAPQLSSLYKGKNQDFANTLQDVQLRTLEKRQWPPINSFPESFDVKPRNDPDFEMDFMFLVWLDTRHDNTFKGSFKDFVTKSGIASVLFGAKSNTVNRQSGNNYSIWNKAALGRDGKIRITPMIGRILDLFRNKKGEYKSFTVKKDNINVTKAGNWESIIKRNLAYIFELKDDGYDVSVSNFNPNIFDPNITNVSKKVIYIGVDQEDNDQKTISQALMQTKNRLGAGNGEYSGRKLKLLQPYMTIAHMLDPGKSMPMIGIKGDIVQFMSPKAKTLIAWNFAKTKFNVGQRLTVSVEHNNLTGDYYLNVNGWNIKPGASASTAQQNSSPTTKVSKFMGDFLQVLYMSSIAGRGSRVAIGTGDGVMTALYSFIMKRCFGRSPRLIMDLSSDKKLRLIGMDDILVKSELTKVTTNNTTVAAQNAGNWNRGVAMNRGRRATGQPLRKQNVKQISENKSGIFNRFFGQPQRLKSNTPK